MFESTLAILKPPPSRTFEAVHYGAMHFDDANKKWHSVLGGKSAKLYSRNDDLVLLKQPEYEDRLTAFVHRYLPVLFVVREKSSLQSWPCITEISDALSTDHTTVREETGQHSVRT